MHKVCQSRVKRRRGWPSITFHHEFYKNRQGETRIKAKLRPWYVITAADQITELAILVAINGMKEDMKDGRDV